MYNNATELLEAIKSDSIWFCPRIFDHLYTNPDGMYKVCCIGGSSDYSIKTTTPNEWLNGKLLQKARQEMLDSSISNKRILNKHCYRCINQEKNYGNSDRKHHVKNILENIEHGDSSILDQVLLFNPKQDYEIKNRCLILQARIFGNQCNLDCYMCQPGASSTRELMFKKINNRKFIQSWDVSAADMNIKKNSTILKQLVDLAPYIDTFLLQGGEPFVMKNQFEFIEELVKSGHSEHITLEMNSNLTVLGTTKYNILDYVNKFKQLNISASLDGFGKYNDYIRRRSKWDVIIKNLETLKKIPNVNMGVFSTVSLLSILRYNKLEQFCKQQNLEYYTFIVDDPDQLHVKHLPVGIKNKLLKEYSHNPEIVRALEMHGNIKDFFKAMRYIKKNDRFYKTDVFLLYPELKEYFNE